jgi:hypothetical protein
MFGNYGLNRVSLKFNFFYLKLIFLDYFDMLILKIKNIILIYF